MCSRVRIAVLIAVCCVMIHTGTTSIECYQCTYYDPDLEDNPFNTTDDITLDQTCIRELTRVPTVLCDYECAYEEKMITSPYAEDTAVLRVCQQNCTPANTPQHTVTCCTYNKCNNHKVPKTHQAPDTDEEDYDEYDEDVEFEKPSTWPSSSHYLSLVQWVCVVYVDAVQPSLCL